jgi:hypothetical protein
MTRTKRQELPRELFLSHSERDHRFAFRVAEDLRGHHLRVWYAPTQIKGAQQWHDEIGKALERCDWFMVVLSPNSVRSKWVKHELIYALNNSRYQDRIVPVLYKPCNAAKLSWTLGSFQWVDFTEKYESGCKALFKVWGLSGRQP